MRLWISPHPSTSHLAFMQSQPADHACEQTKSALRALENKIQDQSLCSAIDPVFVQNTRCHSCNNQIVKDRDELPVRFEPADCSSEQPLDSVVDRGRTQTTVGCGHWPPPNPLPPPTRPPATSYGDRPGGKQEIIRILLRASRGRWGTLLELPEGSSNCLKAWNRL